MSEYPSNTAAGRARVVVEPVLLELFEGGGVIGQHAATSGAIRQRGEKSGARCTLLDRRNVRRFLDRNQLKTTRILRVANIKSQVKRIRTNEAARLRNQSVKSSLRTAIRSFREAAAAGDKGKANELLVSTSRKLDKAASKGVIHANQAANKKSALSQAANKL
eukprot:gene26205-31488_t